MGITCSPAVTCSSRCCSTRDRWSRLSPHEPGETVRPWLAQIVDLDEYDFTTLLAATAWFRAHPRSGLTVRRVPVPGMHTKWLARRRALVLACLGAAATTVDPAGAVDAAGFDEDADPLDIPADDLDALGLRALPAEVSIVLADADLRAAVGGLRQVTAPIDELAALRLHPDAVLVTENKEPAVAWPDTPGLVIIHSLGNHLDALGHLPWIPRERCWYWGDLDRHGLTLLSRVRSAAPRLASLLMSAAESPPIGRGTSSRTSTGATRPTRRSPPRKPRPWPPCRSPVATCVSNRNDSPSSPPQRPSPKPGPASRAVEFGDDGARSLGAAVRAASS